MPEPLAVRLKLTRFDVGLEPQIWGALGDNLWIVEGAADGDAETFFVPSPQNPPTRSTPHQPLLSLPIQSCRFLRPHLPLILFNLVWCTEILSRCGGCGALLLPPDGRWVGWEWPHQFGSKVLGWQYMSNAEAQATSLVCIDEAHGEGGVNVNAWDPAHQPGKHNPHGGDASHFLIDSTCYLGPGLLHVSTLATGLGVARASVANLSQSQISRARLSEGQYNYPTGTERHLVFVCFHRFSSDEADTVSHELRWPAQGLGRGPATRIHAAIPSTARTSLAPVRNVTALRLAARQKRRDKQDMHLARTTDEEQANVHHPSLGGGRRCGEGRSLASCHETPIDDGASVTISKIIKLSFGICFESPLVPSFTADTICKIKEGRLLVSSATLFFRRQEWRQPASAWGTSHNLEPNLQRLAASPPPTKSARGDQLAGGIWSLRDDEGLQSTAYAGLWPSPCPCPPRITELASVPSVRGDPRSLLSRSSPSIKRDIQTDVQPRDGHRDYPSAVVILRCPIIADRVEKSSPQFACHLQIPTLSRSSIRGFYSMVLDHATGLISRPASRVLTDVMRGCLREVTAEDHHCNLLGIVATSTCISVAFPSNFPLRILLNPAALGGHPMSSNSFCLWTRLNGRDLFSLRASSRHRGYDLSSQNDADRTTNESAAFAACRQRLSVFAPGIQQQALDVESRFVMQYSVPDSLTSTFVALARSGPHGRQCYKMMCWVSLFPRLDDVVPFMEYRRADEGSTARHQISSFGGTAAFSLFPNHGVNVSAAYFTPYSGHMIRGRSRSHMEGYIQNIINVVQAPSSGSFLRRPRVRPEYLVWSAVQIRRNPFKSQRLNGPQGQIPNPAQYLGQCLREEGRPLEHVDQSWLFPPPTGPPTHPGPSALLPRPLAERKHDSTHYP
ncbi:uncharacterized protein CLUP02_08214 [Colletotrichum lupini]|uniref:Uncharacterized protein n=1 Tax=Colletotrichum lupini TaxID=145971 RepID=A0A9Q8SSE9_9PEZI|nr:uncharacterized protein CLUP02_08214 [Colletotrichum lupini]UQC82724.1 hypothetical protein CLUP02_08214 [Colletotrichum lupini]